MSVTNSGEAPKAPWWVLPGLGALVLIIFAGGLVIASFLGNETLLTTMLTATITLGTAVISYFFGSSAGSRAQADRAADTAAKLAGKSDQPVAIAVANGEQTAVPAQKPPTETALPQS